VISYERSLICAGRRGNYFCAACLAIAWVATEVHADSAVVINTDRPAVTESSVVVPAGGLQIETGLTATDVSGQSVVDAPEAYLRYGLSEKTELRLTLPDYVRDGSAAPTAPSGFGDAAVGFKEQLGPVHGFDVAVIASVSLPTGAQAVTSHGYDPGLQLPWSRAFLGVWTLAGQFAGYWPTVAGARNFTREATILLDRQLSEPWDAFIEYAADVPQEGGSRQLLHVGTSYKLAAHHQIDFHAAAGLSAAAPRAFVGVGYSYLLLTH
jgi:hypothetical protein